MDDLELMKSRQSVRRYTDRPLPAGVISALEAEAEQVNAESGMHIRLMAEEPAAFQGLEARYGHFSGVNNYLILAGPRNVPNWEETLGYYGQRLVLKAAELGLNSCWVAGTFRRDTVERRLAPGDGLACVVALGYGIKQGVPHKSKPLEELCPGVGEAPEWFRRGALGAQLAPTAINQQSFRLTRRGDRVKLEDLGGIYSKIDLGIVRYQFERLAGKENFTWEE
ncbi:MAG: nitroreductase family protein [Clostridiales bacterium]|nr:nitroreductase family protein [Clostridiales bacterium]